MLPSQVCGVHLSSGRWAAVGVVGGQHDQARLLLVQCEDLAGGFGELGAAQEVRAVGEIAG
jgi:hypothetical protein